MRASRFGAGKAGASALSRLRRASAGVEGHLGAGDRAHPEELRRVGELERAVQAVVIRERERLVSELRRPDRELLGLRGSVEERVRAVAVELDVAHDYAAGS